MGLLGGSLEALGNFGGVDFCPLSLEIRGVTRNLSSMHSICTSPILILFVRLPPPRPDKILPKYCHQFLWRRYPGRMKSKDYVNFCSLRRGGRARPNKVYYGRCHKVIYSDFLLQKMNLGSITKLKAPVAETKCNVDKGFSLYPRAEISFREGVCPGSVHPFESNSSEKKGRALAKKFHIFIFRRTQWSITSSSTEYHQLSQDRLCSVTEHTMLLRCFLELMILSAKKG